MSVLFYALHQQLVHTGMSHPNLWLIERRASLELPWKLSVGFPLSMTHSALEFFVHERDRIWKNTHPTAFEGMRIVLMVDGNRIEIGGIEAAPGKLTRKW